MKVEGKAASALQRQPTGRYHVVSRSSPRSQPGLAAAANRPYVLGMKRTPEDIASTIDGFVNGTGNQWAWDGFTSIRLDDPKLEAIRKEILALPVEFPPSNPRDYCGEAGLEKMRQIVRDLRARSTDGALV